MIPIIDFEVNQIVAPVIPNGSSDDDVDVIVLDGLNDNDNVVYYASGDEITFDEITLQFS